MPSVRKVYYFNSEELNIHNDIKNVQEVMNSNISTPDYTALSLIHEQMVQMSKTRPTKIPPYLEQVKRFIDDMKVHFDSNKQRYLYRLESEQLEEACRIRWRKRTRQAPERLNITTTKSKSYL